jgi:uroporphyrin-III C-methyltransferase
MKNELKDSIIKKGMVFIVGAGPGDPDLITVKGRSLLESADVVIYDQLISNDLLETFDKKKISLSVKTEFANDSTQRIEHIYDDIDTYISRGYNVVRLKGGDPFLFGRGWEEIGLLRRKQIKFEIVPGVSSALGVPTSIGLPLTQRDLSSSILIVTGRRKRGEDLDWKNVSQFQGTVVILMGISEIERITAELMLNGMDGNKPVVVIQNGTRVDEKIISGNLSEIAQRVKREMIRSPGIIIIGDVVRLWLLDHFIGNNEKKRS